MKEEKPSVENEIDDHKNDLDTWIGSITAQTIPQSMKGVTDRFVRDCNILKNDLDEKDTPTMSDLVDFTDRRNSLEIQYIHITSDLS